MSGKRKRIKWNGEFAITKDGLLELWPDASRKVVENIEGVKTKIDALKLLYGTCPRQILLQILKLKSQDWNLVGHRARAEGVTRERNDPRIATGFWELNSRKGKAVLRRFDLVNDRVRSGVIRTSEQLSVERDKIIDFVNKTLLEAEYVTWHAIQQFAYRPENKRHFPHPKQLLKTEVESEEPRYILRDRQWDDPEIIVADKDAWNRPGQRIGCISRIDLASEGFRAGTVRLGFEVFALEGTHFNTLIGGLVNKKGIASLITKRTFGLNREDKKVVVNNILDELAKALASLIPRIRKPGGKKKEFVRLYISVSPTYDGVYGHEIALRLQQLRPEDIRVDKPGGKKRVVKFVDRYLWFLTPTRHRMPSRYHSTAAEKEIDEKRGQTSQTYPDLWVVGAFASAVHKPGGGERIEPYVTIPSCHRLEEVRMAENQIGVLIIEYPSKTSSPRIRVWSFRDIIARERNFITGIKTGADDIHREIVEFIKEEGALTVGLCSDHLGIEDRHVVEEALDFLVEDEMSERKTWPGLHYTKGSQEYDFHLDWMQERMGHPLPKGPFNDDSILFFGCLHAGYRTTDYKYVVNEFPKIILENDVSILCGLGDFIAGIQHSMHCTGEVFGSLNNTDQERLAAELLATIMYKVFVERFDRLLAQHGTGELSSEELSEMMNDALMKFLFIPGNHDLWQERDGNDALEIFRSHLIDVLLLHISQFLSKQDVFVPTILDIIRSKIEGFPDFEAYYTLPSGLVLVMKHPHMARSKTTTLRVQETLKALPEPQIIGIANFHTATSVHEWWSDRGQRVAVQVGAQLLFTRFEARKTKVVDFGPVFLRVLSKNGRIVVTDTAFFSEPLLKEQIPKSTDINQLRKKLGILTLQ